jgi:hypothetical protein
MISWCAREQTYLGYQHRHLVLTIAPVELVPPPLLLLPCASRKPGQRRGIVILRAHALSAIGPLVARPGIEEARTLGQDQLVQQIALLFSRVCYDDLDIASVREDGELILWLVRRTPKVRPMRAVSARSRGARRVRSDGGRATDGERALSALRVWVGNHALLRVSTVSGLLGVCLDVQAAGAATEGIVCAQSERPRLLDR